MKKQDHFLEAQTAAAGFASPYAKSMPVFLSES
jgi:hypothetical protein